jgi:hypothetical protein
VLTSQPLKETNVKASTFSAKAAALATTVDLSPISKTQAEWEKIFSNEAYKELACKVDWDKQSDQDMLDIYTYMYKHAFDSPSPLKCK